MTLWPASVRRRARTLQTIDPIGSLAAGGLVPPICLLAFGYALYSTASQTRQITSPGLAAAALVAAAAACAAHTILTRPTLAPYGRRSHLAVMALAVAASTLFSASLWGDNQRLQDDWGQMLIALLALSMPLYRPVTEALASASVAAVILAATAAAQTPFLAAASPPLVYIAVAATPVVAFAAGGAAYASTMTGSVLDWDETARSALQRLEPQVRESTARAVHQETITMLNEGAIPFLAGILERDVITDDDIARARELATAVRRGAVADVDRGWLGESVRRALGSKRGGHVIDPGHLADGIGPEQRSVVSATIAALATLPGFDPATLDVRLTGAERTIDVQVSAEVAGSRRRILQEFTPYVLVLRLTAARAQVQVGSGSFRLRFAYREEEKNDEHA